MYSIVDKLHKIDFNNFGYLKLVNGNLEGSHQSWSDYLKFESSSWLKNVYFNKEISEEKFGELKNKLNLFLDKNNFDLPIGKLVHGDLNPGNSFVKDGKITAFLDFEWAISGDPLWDYCLNDFSKRIDDNKLKLYETLKYLFKASNVSEMKTSKIPNKNELLKKYLHKFERGLADE